MELCGFLCHVFHVQCWICQNLASFPQTSKDIFQVLTSDKLFGPYKNVKFRAQLVYLCTHSIVKHLKFEDSDKLDHCVYVEVC